jgi:hypothetical protein
VKFEENATVLTSGKMSTIEIVIASVGGSLIFLGILIHTFVPNAFFNIHSVLQKLFGIDVETGFAAHLYISEGTYQRLKPWRRYAKRVLILLNIITLAFGIFLFAAPIFGYYGYRIYDTVVRQTLLLCSTGVFFVILSYCAIRGALSTTPTLKLLFYYYFSSVLLIFGLLLWMLVSAYPDVYELILDTNWDKFKVFFPDSYRNLDRASAVALLNKWFNTHMSVVVGFIGYAVIYAITGIASSVLILSLTVISRSLMSVINATFIVASVVIFVVVELYNQDVVSKAMVTTTLAVMAMTSFIGIRASQTRKNIMLKMYLSLSALSLVLMIGSAVVSSTRHLHFEEITKNELTAGELNALAVTIGVKVSYLGSYYKLRAQITSCVMVIIAILQLLAGLSAFSLFSRGDKVEMILGPSQVHLDFEMRQNALYGHAEELTPHPPVRLSAAVLSDSSKSINNDSSRRVTKSTASAKLEAAPSQRDFGYDIEGF